MEIIGAQNLKKIEELVNIAIEAQTDEILQKAQDECANIRAQSDSEELVSAIDNISVQQKQIAERCKSMAAKNQRDNLKKYLLLRQDCIDGIFEKATQKLLDFSKSENYGNYLLSLIKNEKDGFVVLLAKKDMAYATLFDDNCRESEDIKVGGLMLVYEDENIMIDKSFDSRLSDCREDFLNRYGKQILAGGNE